MLNPSPEPVALEKELKMSKRRENRAEQSCQTEQPLERNGESCQTRNSKMHTVMQPHPMFQLRSPQVFCGISPLKIDAGMLAKLWHWLSCPMGISSNEWYDHHRGSAARNQPSDQNAAGTELVEKWFKPENGTRHKRCALATQTAARKVADDLAERCKRAKIAPPSPRLVESMIRQFPESIEARLTDGWTRYTSRSS